MTRSSTIPSCSLAVTVGGCPAGLNRSALPMTLTKTRSSSAGSARTVGRSSGNVRRTVRPASPSSSSARGAASSMPTSTSVRPSDSGLQPAHVQKVLHQPGERVQGLIGGGEQLVAIVVGEGHPGVAQAGHRCLRGGQRGAQVVADCGEQCRTHPVRFGEGARGGSLLGEPLLSQGESGLGGERLDDAPVAGVERVPRSTRASSPPLPGSPAAVTGTSTSPSPGNAQGGHPRTLRPSTPRGRAGGRGRQAPRHDAPAA